MTAAALELLALALALGCALSVRPWRMLRAGPGQALATPLLATLALLPWLWAWPALAALPIPLHWSAAPLAVLLLGWPLAVPVLVAAGAATALVTGAGWSEALMLTFWSGVLPATMVLVLGHGVRKAFGHHPVAYLFGRALLVPLAALVACGLGAAAVGQGIAAPTGDLHRIALLLLALGEASWTCAIASLLVAYRPQWLATWSDALYLGRPAAAPVRGRRQ
jgi:uncharacterized membrane protein